MYFETYDKSECTGCGICEMLCPKNCIHMKEDECGFFYPEKDESLCINCGLCVVRCGNIRKENSFHERAYLAINNNSVELKQSSSGGIFLVLAKYVIDQGGIVFGVKNNEQLLAVHDYSSTFEECFQYCGSKYMRSDIGDSYKKVKEFLDERKIVLFTGTSCQINALKMYLNKDYSNLILCDIICHANPSAKMFDMYRHNLEKIKGKKVIDIKFRTKETGWKKQIPVVQYEDGMREEEDTFFMAFIGELLARDSCHQCHFASNKRVSDFTIGDFWGVKKICPDFEDNDTGISLCLVNTDKAMKIWNNVSDKMIIREVQLEGAMKNNHGKNVLPNDNRDIFLKGISEKKITENNIIFCMKKYIKGTYWQRIKRKIRKLL